jgi:hypothetical protein
VHDKEEKASRFFAICSVSRVPITCEIGACPLITPPMCCRFRSALHGIPHAHCEVLIGLILIPTLTDRHACSPPPPHTLNKLEREELLCRVSRTLMSERKVLRLGCRLWGAYSVHRLIKHHFQDVVLHLSSIRKARQSRYSVLPVRRLKITLTLARAFLDRAIFVATQLGSS